MEVSIGKSLISGPFSIAMFDYQRIHQCTFQDKALHGTSSFVKMHSRPRLRQKSQQCLAQVPFQDILRQSKLNVVDMALSGPIGPHPLEGIGVVGPKMHLSMYSQLPSISQFHRIIRILALVPLIILFT